MRRKIVYFLYFSYNQNFINGKKTMHWMDLILDVYLTKLDHGCCHLLIPINSSPLAFMSLTLPLWRHISRCPSFDMCLYLLYYFILHVSFKLETSYISENEIPFIRILCIKQMMLFFRLHHMSTSVNFVANVRH